VALNVHTNLDYFDLINPCGTGRRATSIAKILGREFSIEEVESLAIEFFKEVFNIELKAEPLYKLEPYFETNLVTSETT